MAFYQAMSPEERATRRRERQAVRGHMRQRITARLKKAMHRKGINVHQLEREMGFPYGNIEAYLEGRHQTMSLDRLLSIAYVLELRPNDLLDGVWIAAVRAVAQSAEEEL